MLSKWGPPVATKQLCKICEVISLLLMLNYADVNLHCFKIRLQSNENRLNNIGLLNSWRVHFAKLDIQHR